MFLSSPMKNLKLDKETLEELYLTQNKTMLEIGKIFSLHKMNIYRRLKKFNIPTCGRGQHEPWNKNLTKETVPRVAKYGLNGSKTKQKLSELGLLTSWNKNLIKETDERVAKYGRACSKTRKGKPTLHYPDCTCPWCSSLFGEDNQFYDHKHDAETRQRMKDNAPDRSGPNNHSYIDGRTKIKNPYPKEFDEALRTQIRIRDNYTCQLTGITEEEHLLLYGRRLHIHHIDYNKQNSDPLNLITLSQEAHMRTNYHRDYWQAKLTKLVAEKQAT